MAISDTEEKLEKTEKNEELKTSGDFVDLNETSESDENADVIPKADKPSYIDRYYLLFGGKDVPQGLNYEKTLSFLTQKLHTDGGEMRRAREGQCKTVPSENADANAECCSYCGAPISGVAFYRLSDGRKRCTACSRTMVTSVEALDNLFKDVIDNMELFFGVSLDTVLKVELLEERKLKRKLHSSIGDADDNSLILGCAVNEKKKYTVYIENGAPRISIIGTIAHELTHVWQYMNWKQKEIAERYGKGDILEVYEGMAKWCEIQYLYHVGEKVAAQREELICSLRDDEYGRGFLRFAAQYPLQKEPMTSLNTPFAAGSEVLN